MLSGGIDNRWSIPLAVLPLSTLLRFFLVVAFSLDGSASLWSASSMAASMAGHGVGTGTSQRVHHETGPVAAIDVDCPDAKFAGGSASGHEVAHESCDCSSDACQCPVGFTIGAVAHTVPFAAQQRVTTELTVAESASIARGSLSLVFRPPIG